MLLWRCKWWCNDVYDGIIDILYILIYIYMIYIYIFTLPRINALIFVAPVAAAATNNNCESPEQWQYQQALGWPICELCLSVWSWVCPKDAAKHETSIFQNHDVFGEESPWDQMTTIVYPSQLSWNASSKSEQETCDCHSHRYITVFRPWAPRFEPLSLRWAWASAQRCWWSKFAANLLRRFFIHWFWAQSWSACVSTGFAASQWMAKHLPVISVILRLSCHILDRKNQGKWMSN